MAGFGSYREFQDYLRTLIAVEYSQDETNELRIQAPDKAIGASGNSEE
jgi:hypothetical protein